MTDGVCSSPGLEEYIEALSFLHYLEHRVLITLEQVQETLSDTESGQVVRSTSFGRRGQADASTRR